MLAASGYRPGATLQLLGGRDKNRGSTPKQLSRPYHPRVRVESDKPKKQISPSAQSIRDRRWTATSPAKCHSCTPCISVNRKAPIHENIFDLHTYTSLLPFYFSFILYQCLTESGDAPDPQHGRTILSVVKISKAWFRFPGTGFVHGLPFSVAAKLAFSTAANFRAI